MDLDFKTVKALSSPTRIKILNCILEKERTPTSISNEIDKTKSTVSSHIDKLLDSDLVVKDEEEGRKRVVYKPTDKAKHIVKGKEKKVRFTLTSSALSLLGAIGVFWTSLGAKTGKTASSGEEVEDFTMDAPSDAGTEQSLANDLLGEQLGEYLYPGIGGLLLVVGLLLAWQSFNYLKLKSLE